MKMTFTREMHSRTTQTKKNCKLVAPAPGNVRLRGCLGKEVLSKIFQ